MQATYLSQGRVTRCALTSPILASAISHKQDTEAFFAVFYAAVRKYGVPEVLVSDNGSIFTSHETRRLCEQLGIAKQEIKKGRPYQNWGPTKDG